MNRSGFFALLAAVAVFSAQPASAAKPTKPANSASKTGKTTESEVAAIATVNGKPIPRGRFELTLAGQLARGQADTPELRRAILNQLVVMEILAQAAEKTGIDKTPTFKTYMELQRMNVLVQGYQDDFDRKHQVADADIQREYDAYKTALGDKEYKTKHIVVDSEDIAKDIQTRLGKGEKFADLVKLSKDANSKDKGGDLGWIVPSGLTPPLSEALPKIAAGKCAEAPQKTDFGWHILCVDEIRALTPPTLDALRPRITNSIKQQMFDNEVRALQTKASVKINQ